MPSTTGFVQDDNGVIAVLSSTTTVENCGHSGMITLVRTSSPNRPDVRITLPSSAEAALLALLLARRGVTLADLA